jgi:hypothetical protein
MRWEFKLYIAASACLFEFHAAHAELIAIEPLAMSLKDDLKMQLGESSAVVSVRLVGKGAWPWAVHEALANEITAALRVAGADAIAAASDHRLESLGES